MSLLTDDRAARQHINEARHIQKAKSLPCKGCVRYGRCDISGSCMRGKGDYFMEPWEWDRRADICEI